MRARTILILFVLLAFVSTAFGATAGPRVHLKYAVFDPLAGEPPMPDALRAKAVPERDSYHIVQFHGPIEPAWKSDLSALGADILDYVPDFAFMVRMSSETASKVQDLEQVRWVGLFHPAYKLSPDLQDSQAAADVAIQLFRGELQDPVAAAIRDSAGRILRASSGPGGDHMEAYVPRHALEHIAREKGVAWIEPRLERKLYNDISRESMTIEPVWTDFGLYGSGEVVAVCDTGLDTGNLSTISADFAGRIVQTYALGRKTPPPGKWDDPHGHGTHVAGSVLGSGTLSGSNPSTHSYLTSFAGMAPEAGLVFQSVLDGSGNLGGIPSDLNDLFDPPYADGARVHTNSWGAPYAGAYTTDSHNLDVFTWNHKDMTIVVAAGNEGVDANSDGVVDPGSLDAPATAKNCITVGATEGYRLSGGAQGTYGGYWSADFPVSPISGDKVSNNADGMAAFSGRGPCDDGRIKPDVCAPGTNVISCRSHVSGAGTLWGVYNTNYLYCGGTSMSTPLVAGTSALVREYYRTQRSHTPSAALVKATLINGAADIYPGQYGIDSYLEIPSIRPNNVEGWGRVDLANSIMPSAPRELRFEDYTAGLTTGGSQSFQYEVTGVADPVRVTLVWTDYAAAAYAATALVNDLDLVVYLPDGSTLRGNDTIDRRNNVEGVDIVSPEPGTYTVTVSAHNVPYGPQPFALAVSGDMGSTPPTAEITLPADGTSLAGNVTVEGTAAGGDFAQYVLEYGAGPSPGTWIPIGVPQASPVTDGVLGTWDTQGLPDGDYTIRLIVSAAGGVDSADSALVHIQTTSIGDLRDAPDDTAVTLTGKIVSASPSEFTGTVYVQEPDRSCGIKVVLGTAQTDAQIGSLVTVTGVLGTAGIERVVTSPQVIVTGSASEPMPAGMSNGAVGGSDSGAYIQGVTGGTGLNNIGLLVRTWGRVTYVGPSYFYLDDGTGLQDGSGYMGVKVYTGILTPPSDGQYAVVTGISIAELSGSDVRRLIRVRRQSDLVYY